MTLLLAIWVIGAPIAVQVDEVGELERDQALEVARSVTRAIETRTASTAQLEDPVWWGCTERIERCLEDLRARSGASEVVTLRLFGSVRAIRVVGQRFRPSQAAPFAVASIDLPRSSTTAPATLDRLALLLFPEARRSLVQRRPPAAATSRFGPVPWILIGSGVVAIAVGSAFAISSLGAKSELESGTQSHVAFEDLSGRMDTHGALAGALFVGAGAATIAALTLWLLDDGVDVPTEPLDRASEGASLFVP